MPSALTHKPKPQNSLLGKDIKDTGVACFWSLGTPFKACLQGGLGGWPTDCGPQGAERNRLELQSADSWTSVRMNRRAQDFWSFFLHHSHQKERCGMTALAWAGLRRIQQASGTRCGERALAQINRVYCCCVAKLQKAGGSCSPTEVFPFSHSSYTVELLLSMFYKLMLQHTHR